MRTKQSGNGRNAHPVRRARTVITLSTVVSLGALSSVAGAQSIRIILDGQIVNFPDVQPMFQNGRIMVPLRGVFDRMNAYLDWDDATQTVIAKRGRDTIVLPLNAYFATIDGQQMNLSSPARMYMGRTMVPLRFLSESLGASLDWTGNNRTVAINTLGGNMPRSTNASYSSQNASDGSAGSESNQVDYPARIRSGTVIAFQLNEDLSSNHSQPGDRFTASMDSHGSAMVQQFPKGVVLEGHVSFARPKSRSNAGLLGLTFDRLRMQNGHTYPISASVIGLDAASVANVGGHWSVVPGYKPSNMTIASSGLEGGSLIRARNPGPNQIAALQGTPSGLLMGERPSDRSASTDLNAMAGTRFGLRFTQDLVLRKAKSGN